MNIVRTYLRTLTIGILAFFTFPGTFAQIPNSVSPKPESQISLGDECGDPSVESQLYAYRQAKVTRILSSTEMRVKAFTRNGNVDVKNFTVRLVGIKPNTNATQIKTFLIKNVLNRNVEIIGNPRKKKDTNYGAIVRFLDNSEDEMDELNEHMIETGVAGFMDFDSDNLVPFYWPCRLEKAQERARAAKLGIWVNFISPESTRKSSL